MANGFDLCVQLENWELMVPLWTARVSSRVTVGLFNKCKSSHAYSLYMQNHPVILLLLWEHSRESVSYLSMETSIHLLIP